MFPNTDQYTAATKALFTSQFAAFNEPAAIALQGTDRFIALNTAATQACIENCVGASKDLMGAKDPQTFFSLVTAYAKPNSEQASAYSRQLADIMSSTKAEFSRTIEARVAEIQDKLGTAEYTPANLFLHGTEKKPARASK